MQETRRRVTALINRYPKIISLLAGLISACGFEPLGLWPLSLLALALMFELVAAAPNRKSALLLGWLFGLGHFTLGLNWIATAFTFQAAMPAWLGWIAVVLLSLYLAIYPGLAFLGGWIAAKGEVHLRPLVFGIALCACWIISEWLRSWVISGFAWNPLGAAFVDMAWAARLTGSYGLSGMVIMAAGAFWMLVRGYWKSAIPLLAIPAVLSLAGNVTMKHDVLNSYLNADHIKKITSIQIVQPNINQSQKWEAQHLAENFRRLAEQTHAPDVEQPRMIFWPEAAIPDYLEDGYPTREYYPANSAAQNRIRLAQLINPDDLLITGALRLNFGADKSTGPVSAGNSVIAIDAQGRYLGHADKSHLVPFGEYVPLKPISSAIGISRLVPGSLFFEPGPGPQTLDLGDYGKMGVQICYEIIFSGEVVDRDNRPDFIFNPSNDAWFGSWGPPQHLAQARLRALEEGLPVIRSTPTGISAIIDAQGGVIKSIPAGQEGHISDHRQDALQPTFFSLYGNIIPLTLALLMLLGCWYFTSFFQSARRTGKVI